MELQDFLKEHGLEELKARYAIKCSQDSEYPHLVCLKYSQIDSPMSELIVRQCRGIVLDSRDWSIVSYPYDKFFNYGEGHAAPIDWSTAKTYEKLDGSLMTLYHCPPWIAGDNCGWRVQSSGTSDGAGEVNGFGISFSDLFWKVWNELGYHLPYEVDHCFMFELMTPFNRVVVQHKTNRLVLHGVRNVRSLKERDPMLWFRRYGWEVVEALPLRSWTEILDAAKKLDPMASEGYVVCDSAFNRVKVKSPLYVAMHHLRDSLSPRRMIEVVMSNEGEEFLAYFPEWTEIYQDIKGRYDRLVEEIENTYAQHQGIGNQKDFALAIKDLPYSGILFALRAGKCNDIKTALAATTIQKMEGLLKIEAMS